MPKIVASIKEIGEGVTFGQSVDIRVHGAFRIGDHSHIGDGTKIRGNNVTIGRHFYNSRGLIVGGGGCDSPFADLTIGDRVVIHSGFLNLCEPVEICDDAACSPEFAILTHGFRLNYIKGHPRKFGKVVMGPQSWLGYRAVLLPGATLERGVVVGACSVVARPITEVFTTWAGNPAVKVGEIYTTDDDQKRGRYLQVIADLIDTFRALGVELGIDYEYPLISVKDAVLDLVNETLEGQETDLTDAVRDHLRKWGIRIYTERPFGNIRRL